jgi:hypothetical protein
MDEKSLINNKDVLNAMGNDDKILLCKKVIKINRYGLSQERFLIITEKNIYNFKKTSK